MASATAAATNRRSELPKSTLVSRPAPIAPPEPPGTSAVPPIPPLPHPVRPAYPPPAGGTYTARASRGPMVVIIASLVVIAAVIGGGYFYIHRTVPDEIIVANLKAKFDADQNLRGAMLGIACQKGIVTLAGFVNSDADKSNAMRIADAEPGVKQVVAQLMVTNAVVNGINQFLTGGVQPAASETGQSSPSGGVTTNQPAANTTPQDQQEISSPPTQVVSSPHTNQPAPPPAQPTVQVPPARPAIVQAIVQQGGTSLKLAPGHMYIYALVTGGAVPTSAFASGDYAEATNAAGQLCAALAYGSNSENSYTTQTDYHVIGGVSVSGTWDDMKAYYGSNSRAGASIVAAPFTVSKESLVIVIASAASEKRATLYGIPGLQIDQSSSNGALPMVIGHAYLQPGSYTASETSSAVGGQDPVHMADLIGVFVFSFNQ
jgi:hypothetical protein